MRAVRTPERQESRKTFLGSNGGCQSVRVEGRGSSAVCIGCLFHILWSKTLPYNGTVLLPVETSFPIGTVPWPRAGIARTTWRCRLQRTQSAAKLGEKLPAGISFGPSPPPKERRMLSPPKTLLLHLVALASRRPAMHVAKTPRSAMLVNLQPLSMPLPAQCQFQLLARVARSVGCWSVRLVIRKGGVPLARSLGPA